jgi:hypothetical protein
MSPSRTRSTRRSKVSAFPYTLLPRESDPESSPRPQGILISNYSHYLVNSRSRTHSSETPKQHTDPLSRAPRSLSKVVSPASNDETEKRERQQRRARLLEELEQLEQHDLEDSNSSRSSPDLGASPARNLGEFSMGISTSYDANLEATPTSAQRHRNPFSLSPRTHIALRTPLATRTNIGNATPPGSGSSDIIRETQEDMEEEQSEQPNANTTQKKAPSQKKSPPMRKFETLFGFELDDRTPFLDFQVLIRPLRRSKLD